MSPLPHGIKEGNRLIKISIASADSNFDITINKNENTIGIERQSERVIDESAKKAYQRQVEANLSQDSNVEDIKIIIDKSVIEIVVSPDQILTFLNYSTDNYCVITINDENQHNINDKFNLQSLTI